MQIIDFWVIHDCDDEEEKNVWNSLKKLFSNIRFRVCHVLSGTGDINMGMKTEEDGKERPSIFSKAHNTQRDVEWRGELNS